MSFFLNWCASYDGLVACKHRRSPAAATDFVTYDGKSQASCRLISKIADLKCAVGLIAVRPQVTAVQV